VGPGAGERDVGVAGALAVEGEELPESVVIAEADAGRGAAPAPPQAEDGQERPAVLERQLDARAVGTRDGVLLDVVEDSGGAQPGQIAVQGLRVQRVASVRA